MVKLKGTNLSTKTGGKTRAEGSFTYSSILSKTLFPFEKMNSKVVLIVCFPKGI